MPLLAAAATSLLGVEPFASRVLPAVAAGNHWIDSVSATIGEDKNSNQMDIYRIGVQNRWNRTWFNDGAWYLGGYWDVSLGYMESGYDDSDLYDFGVTPVLRLQRDAELARLADEVNELEDPEDAQESQAANDEQ